MDLKEELKTGDEIIIQIAPYGDFKAETVDKKPITERFDQQSFEKLINIWDGKDIRVDFDHQSEIGDNTQAAGWISKLYVDPEAGLFGTLTVSDAGAKALSGLDYRYVSPVFIFDDEYPIKLKSVALTNRPRLDMPAVWNSMPRDEKIVINECTEIGVNNSEKQIMEISKLIEILGLPAEATEDDILNAITEIKKMIEEKDAKEEAPVEEAPKEEITNCGDKEKEVTNSAEVETEKTVVNFAEAQHPALTPEESMRKEYFSLPGGDARVEFIKKHTNIKF